MEVLALDKEFEAEAEAEVLGAWAVLRAATAATSLIRSRSISGGAATCCWAECGGFWGGARGGLICWSECMAGEVGGERGEVAGEGGAVVLLLVGALKWKTSAGCG